MEDKLQSTDKQLEIELVNFKGIGKTLIAIRVATGMKKGILASKLGVANSQISRDEANEYQGASVEKIQKVLKVLGAELKMTIKFPNTNGASARISKKRKPEVLK